MEDRRAHTLALGERGRAALEGRYSEILDDRERVGAPRFDTNLGAVAEVPHVELTGCRSGRRVLVLCIPLIPIAIMLLKRQSSRERNSLHPSR
jgi:hypothetical protein